MIYFVARLLARVLLGRSEPEEAPRGAEHDIAAWRASGKGVWLVSYVVMGYDETFVMRAPGDQSQNFTEKSLQMILARELKRPLNDVIHVSTTRED